jgi:hypothetical protein
VTWILLLVAPLAPTPAWASATVGGGGCISTSTDIQSSTQEFCACDPSAPEIAFPPSPLSPSSATLDCQRCSQTFNTPPNQFTVTVGPTHVDGTLTGDTHSLTFTTQGAGGAGSRPTTLFYLARSESSGDIHFTVSGQPTAVSISVSVSVSGPDENTFVSVTLAGPNGTIGKMFFDNTGAAMTTGSISGGMFDPGTYALNIDAEGQFNNVSTLTGSGDFSFSVTATVSAGVTPATIQWKNPAGGSFDDQINWNPPQVPTSIDTAVFDQSNLLGLIPVMAPNDAVAVMAVKGMLLELNGFLQVLGGDSSGTGFEVGEGGQLLLDKAAALITNDAKVGFTTGAPQSTITVTGAGTHWTVGAANPLSIFDMGKVVVDQGGLLNAQKEIDVGALGTAGALEVHNNALVTTPSLKVAGSGGTSTVTIDSGGAVQAADTVDVGDSGGVTISGVSSDGIHLSNLKLTGGGSLTITGDAMTQVEVKDGGLLSDTSGLISIGNGLTTGNLHVHGTVGSHNASCAAGGIAVGSKVVPSELVVEDGGVVGSGGAVTLGQNDGDLANVSLTSSGLLNVGDLLHVGVFGQATLTIGSITQLSGAEVVSSGGEVGVAPSFGGNGSGEVDISGSSVSSSDWHVTGDCLVGSNAVGKIFLNGTFIPLTSTVAGATLTVDGTLTVEALGDVFGNGKLVTGNRVMNGGTIMPGLSPGRIEIVGNYEQTAAGLLKMEAAGTAPGDFDVLHMTGNATLDGTMEVTFLKGYLPKAGDVLPLVQIDGSLSGDFAHMTFPQLAPGFQVTEQFVNGMLQLTALNDATELCVGDCDGSGMVTINELIQLVSFALGTSTDCSKCPSGILANITCTQVTVPVIIQAVNNALSSCPAH